jgi:O-antigen/teichoic acid export membrane protein
MSGGRSLLRLATPLMVGRGISAVLTFSIPIVLARVLDPASYGTYKQFFLLAATVYLVGQVGLTASLYYFLPRHPPEERGRYYIQALTGLFFVGAAAGACVLLFSGALASRFSNPLLLELGPPLALYVWFYLAAAPLEIGLTACKRTGWAGTTYVLSDLVRVTALIGPVYLGAGVRGLAWAVTVFAGARFLAAWALGLSGALGKAQLPSRKAVTAQLGYSLPFAGAVLLATAQMQLPQYVVAAFSDAATYAIFAVGVLQIPLTDMLYTPIAEVMMVRLAAGTEADAPAVFREAVARLSLFFLPLTAFALAVGPELIPTLYTVTYLAAVPIFLVALIELPLSALPVDGLLRSFNATGTLLRIGLFRLAFAVVVVPAAFFAFGLAGAMLGYVVTQWTVKTLMLVRAARRLGVPARSLIPWPEVRNWAARSLVLFGAVTALRLHGPWHGVVFLAIAAVLAALIWVASLLSAGELRRAVVLKEAHG